MRDRMIGYTPQFHSLVSKKGIQLRQGFTLVELIVTLSIFLIITSVILFNGRTNQRQIQIRGIAYDVAYIMQKVQVLGRSAVATGTNEGSQIYGVRFHYSGGSIDTIQVYKDGESTSAGSPASFNSASDAVVDSFAVPNGIKIELCSVFSYGTVSPATQPGCTTIYTPVAEALVESRRLSQDISDVVLDTNFNTALGSGSAFALKISSLTDVTTSRYVVVGRTGFVSIF